MIVKWQRFCKNDNQLVFYILCVAFTNLIVTFPRITDYKRLTTTLLLKLKKIMKNIILIITCLIVSSFSFAQTGGNKLLNHIKENNKTLKYYKVLNKAQKLENKTGLFPENPEVEFGMLSGSPSSVGMRTDISVSQKIDFPTVYVHRKKIAKIGNQISDIEYRQLEYKILLKAKLLMAQYLHYKQMNKELIGRVESAKKLYTANEQRFKVGDISRIEKNKSNLFHLNIQKEYDDNNIEFDLAKNRLIGINGGLLLDFKSIEEFRYAIPADFEIWYKTQQNKIPALTKVSKQIDIRNKQIKLNKALNLPKLTVGYMSESVADGEQFAGIKVGISIPLWENNNRVKMAKAKALASQELLIDTRNNYYIEYKSIYAKSKNIKKSLNSYKDSLSELNSEALLKKAYDTGELSLIDYLLELSLYYEANTKIIETTYELNINLIKLNNML